MILRNSPCPCFGRCFRCFILCGFSYFCVFLSGLFIILPRIVFVVVLPCVCFLSCTVYFWFIIPLRLVAFVYCCFRTGSCLLYCSIMAHLSYISRCSLFIGRCPVCHVAICSFICMCVCVGSWLNYIHFRKKGIAIVRRRWYVFVCRLRVLLALLVILLYFTFFCACPISVATFSYMSNLFPCVFCCCVVVFLFWLFWLFFHRCSCGAFFLRCCGSERFDP